MTFTKRAPFVLTYHIRPEARWSDGTPVTAADFVFTHGVTRKYGDPEHGHRTDVRSVQALDPKTVRVVLRSRIGGFRSFLFERVLPRHALWGEDLLAVWRDGIDNPKTGEPIGSGPFLVERWDRGEQITLRRNPRYWGPHPAYVDRVVIRFGVEGDGLIDGFRDGKIDLAYSYPPHFFSSVRRVPGVRARVLPNAGWDYVEIRIGPGGHPALRNKLVRRALAFGIDRRRLVRAAFAELDRQGRRRDSLVFPTFSPYYRSNWSRYRHRPEEARRLLELEGCSRRAGETYVCAGQPLSLRLVITAVPGDYRPRVVELLQAQLRRVGVEVVPDFATAPAIFNQILPSGNFDLALFAYSASGPGSQLRGIFDCGGDGNFTGYCQRLVTRDLIEAERVFDVGQQARVLNRVDVEMARDVPAIPLFERPLWAALRLTVRGFSPSPADPLVNAENWWLAD